MIMYTNPNLSYRIPWGAAQRGLSLIELLVGLTIGLLVMLAALGSLSFTRVSALTVTDTVRLRQDASIAMGIIGRQLRSAHARGFQQAASAPDVANVSFVPFTGVIPAGAAEQASVYGADGVTASAPDTLTVTAGFSPGVAPTTCLGFNSNLVDTVTSRFDVFNGALRCAGSDGQGAQELITNVEDFQVWYGVRDAADNIQYRTASQLGVLNWTTIASVMVCLRLSGTTNTVPQPPVGFAAPRGCNGENLAWDGRFRKVFRQVFTLRNPA